MYFFNSCFLYVDTDIELGIFRAAIRWRFGLGSSAVVLQIHSTRLQVFSGVPFLSFSVLLAKPSRRTACTRTKCTVLAACCSASGCVRTSCSWFKRWRGGFGHLFILTSPLASRFSPLICRLLFK